MMWLHLSTSMAYSCTQMASFLNIALTVNMIFMHNDQIGNHIVYLYVASMSMNIVAV